jgi:hypothetical protein
MTTPQVAHDRTFPVAITRAPRLRASDADRAAVVTVLQDAVARGLLSYDEGDDRMAAAFAARHLDDLPPLTADLPAPPSARPQAPGWRRVGSMVIQQVRYEISATAAAGIRSRRFLVAVLVVLMLTAMVFTLGGLAAHGAGGDFGNGGGFGPHRFGFEPDNP